MADKMEAAVISPDSADCFQKIDIPKKRAEIPKATQAHKEKPSDLISRF